MSNIRETTLHLLQDATGKTLDLRLEQEVVPKPKYVFEPDTYSNSGRTNNGDASLMVFGRLKSYKTVGSDKTVIPVPLSVNGKSVTPGADGTYDFTVFFDTATMEPDPANPLKYECVARFVQEESGETFSLPYNITVKPYLFMQPVRPVTMSGTGEDERTFDFVLKHASYEDLVVAYDSEETAAWLRASIVGKQLHVTCEKNNTGKERSGRVKLSIGSYPSAYVSVNITQGTA